MYIPIRFRYLVSGLLLTLAAGCSKEEEKTEPPKPPVVVTPVKSQVGVWLTNSNKSALFARQRVALNFAPAAASNQNPTIVVDTTQTFQPIDGFGYTLTGGSALVMNRMPAAGRQALIKELFATDSTWLGVSYLRVSIGASDLDAQVFTYDDAPAGQADETLSYFSLAPDKANLIPVLKEILAINPAIKIMGSPWTAPLWMKTNRNSVGGRLKPEYYDAYARYFVKYIQGMAAEGIRIDAVTIQNEPLHGGNNPSMEMSAEEQADFIKNHIGPAFRTAGISTKIIAYDHNADRPDYPITVLSDAGARPFVDGSAFHLYGGNINALTQVHNAFPDKNVYFTEQWVGAPGNFPNDLSFHVRELIIGATRNWSRNVLEWNLAADPNNEPHTPGGCTQCLPAVTVAPAGTVTRNPAYYIIAHASKFVRPGAVRVGSNIPNNLPNVAFQRPDGKKVLIVLNNSSAAQTFNIDYRGKVVTTLLYSGSVGTYIW